LLPVGLGGAGGPIPPSAPPPAEPAWVPPYVTPPGIAALDAAAKEKKIEIPQLPTAAGFRDWRMVVYPAVIGASGRTTETAGRWITAVESDRSTFESLYDSDGWDTFDANLLQAVIKAAAGTVVGSQIRRCQEQLFNQHKKFLKGRQALWLIFEHFKVDEGKIGWYDISDLLSVQFVDDAHLQAFMDNWDAVLCAIAKPPSPDDLAVLLLRELSKSKALEYDIATYRRMSASNPEKTYGFLYSAARRYLDEQRRDKNRASIAKSMNRTGSIPAMPSPRVRPPSRGRDPKYSTPTRGRSPQKSPRSVSKGPRPGSGGKRSGSGKRFSKSPRDKGKPRSQSPAKGICHQFLNSGTAMAALASFCTRRRGHPVTVGGPLLSPEVPHLPCLLSWWRANYASAARLG